MDKVRIYKMLSKICLVLAIVHIAHHISSFWNVYSEKIFIVSHFAAIIFAIPCIWVIGKGSYYAREWSNNLLKDIKRKTLFNLIIVYHVSLGAWLYHSGLLEGSEGILNQGNAILFTSVQALWFLMLSTAYNYGIQRHYKTLQGHYKGIA